jgi:hypothetical protein
MCSGGILAGKEGRKVAKCTHDNQFFHQYIATARPMTSKITAGWTSGFRISGAEIASTSYWRWTGAVPVWELLGVSVHVQ